MQRATSRWVRRLGAAALVAFVGWFGASLAVAYTLTRRPHPRHAEPPLYRAAPGEELPWTASDGVSGTAWWSEAPAAVRARAPVVMLLHGLGGTRREWAAVLPGFRERGVATLAVTLRCHGTTDGEVNDFGLGARLDVLALVALLEQRAPGRPLVIVGRSLGAAAALFAAPELGQRVARFVLEAPYNDLSSAVLHRTRSVIGVGLGDLGALGLDLVAPLFFEDPDAIAPARALAALGTGERVVLLAGALDVRAPLEDVRWLSESVEPPARLEVFDEAGHTLCHATDPERWWTIVERELALASGVAD